jgi:hypothetical protein
MEYAWALTPERFTKPNGEVITVDRKNRKGIEVPLPQAREVIKVGRLSAHAWTCDLPVEQTNNYRSLMNRENLKKKWTEQQLLYMNQLHLVTVMLLTGKLELVEDGETKKPKLRNDKTAKKSCTPEQREKVKEAIGAYMASGPPLARKPSSAAGGPVPTKNAGQ